MAIQSARRALFLAMAVVLVCCFGVSGLAQSSPKPRTQWDGVYTDVQADRGSTIYQEQCVSCHSLESLNDRQSAPLLFGTTFSDNWNRITLDEFALRTQTTMPPDRPGSLSASQLSDLVAYMLRLGGAPSGQTDLPSQRAALREFVLTPRP